MISFRLPNGAEFSFPVEWWNEAGMPAFERQSPYYLWDALPYGSTPLSRHPWIMRGLIAFAW